MSDFPIPVKKTDIDSKEEDYKTSASDPFDPEFVNAALKKIQKHIAGNGLKSAQISVQDYKGYNLELSAVLKLNVKHAVSTSQITGHSHNGTQIEKGSLPTKINAIVQTVNDDPTTKDAVLNDIKQKLNGGFGISDVNIPLPIEERFIEKDGCGQCGGQGRSPCIQCNGSALMICYKCSGSRHTQWMMCRGLGRTQAGDAQQMCTYCQGRGQMSCDVCRSNGQINCTQCGATGQKACQPCGATGTVSTASHVTFHAETDFIVEDASVPKVVKALFENSNLKDLPKKDIHTTVVNKDADEQSEEQSHNKEKGIALHYKIVCPYAKINISLAGKKTVPLEVTGLALRLNSRQNFLDILLKKPCVMLGNAAEAKGSAADLITKACKWKTARQAILFSIKHPPRKAFHMLTKNNPLGLSSGCAKHLIGTSHKALKNITRRIRYITLGITSIVSLLLYAAWFSLPIRSSITNQDLIKELACDIGLIVLITALAICAIRYAGYTKLKNTLSALNIKNQAQGWPKAGKASLYALCAQPVLFGIAAYASSEKPLTWLEALL